MDQQEKLLPINWNDKEQVRNYFREYRKRNKEKAIERQRKYRLKNRDMINQKNKEYRIRKAIKNETSSI